MASITNWMVDNSSLAELSHRCLPTDVRLVYLILCQYPRGERHGLFRVIPGELSYYTGISQERVLECLEILHQEQFVITDNGLVWIEAVCRCSRFCSMRWFAQHYEQIRASWSQHRSARSEDANQAYAAWDTFVQRERERNGKATHTQVSDEPQPLDNAPQQLSDVAPDVRPEDVELVRQLARQSLPTPQAAHLYPNHTPPIPHSYPTRTPPIPHPYPTRTPPIPSCEFATSVDL